jgi:hypothetical protein
VYRIRAVVPYGINDPSVRERVYAWQARLSDTIDFSVEKGSLSHSVRASGAADADIVCRNVTPWTQGFAERRVLKTSNLGIYDLDDGLFLDDGRLPGLGKWWKPAFAKARIANRSLEACSRVIAGNELLAEWAQNRCEDVRIIPTCIEPSDYAVHVGAENSDGEASVPNLVWIGSAATTVFLAEIAASLTTAHELTGTRLIVIGDSSATLPTSLMHFTTRISWTPSITKEIGLLGGIGIMPLPNHQYAHYKCAYKLLQYAASSMVTIGSPYGASKTALELFGGLPATTVNNWTEALCGALRMNPQQRKDIGQMARLAAIEHYSFDSWEPSYRSAIGATN